MLSLIDERSRECPPERAKRRWSSAPAVSELSAGRTLVHPLQRCQTTLLAGLSTASTGSVADRSFSAEWESGKQRTLSAFLTRLILQGADIYLSRCAMLTISLVHITGQAKTTFIQY